MWQTVKYVLFGIAWGCTWLVAMACILALWAPTAFAALAADFPRQALGAVCVGVACTLPARLYACRSLPALGRLAIHCAVAMSVYLPVAFTLGWIPYYPEQIGTTVLEILIGLGIFMAIWCVFFLINRREARRINERVRQINGGSKEDA